MLADMRWQYACMLADIGFVAGPGRGGGRAWMDERGAAFNRYASHPGAGWPAGLACWAGAGLCSGRACGHLYKARQAGGRQAL